MGTRHLICVVSKGQYRVTQYGQWDGYPSGQGVKICRFIHGADLAKFARNVELVKSIDNGEIKRRCMNLGADDSGLVSFDMADEFNSNWPHLSRDTGYGVLKMIESDLDEVGPISLDFAANSLFCEWAYVLDLDVGVLEIYQGFNHQPVPDGERFASLPRHKNHDGTDSEYYPVRLVEKIHFDQIKETDDLSGLMDRVQESTREKEAAS